MTKVELKLNPLYGTLDDAHAVMPYDEHSTFEYNYISHHYECLDCENEYYYESDEYALYELIKNEEWDFKTDDDGDIRLWLNDHRTDLFISPDSVIAKELLEEINSGCGIDEYYLREFLKSFFPNQIYEALSEVL